MALIFVLFAVHINVRIVLIMLKVFEYRYRYWSSVFLLFFNRFVNFSQIIIFSLSVSLIFVLFEIEFVSMMMIRFLILIDKMLFRIRIESESHASVIIHWMWEKKLNISVRVDGDWVHAFLFLLLSLLILKWCISSLSTIDRYLSNIRRTFFFSYQKWSATNVRIVILHSSTSYFYEYLRIIYIETRS